MSDAGHEARIVDLELRFMRAERTIAELSDVIFEQQKTIDKLRADVAAMGERMLASGEPAKNERPPHY
jgi:uncharacterized coiled-coil protein SlyX